MPTKTDALIDVSLSALQDEQRTINDRVLQPVLTDLIAYNMTIKQLHWNVIGPHFRSIHLHLDEVWAEVNVAIDTVAERMDAAGHSPSGRPRDIAANTEIVEVPTGFLRDVDVLRLAEHSTRQIVDLVRERMNQIEDIDTVTADILHGICAGLEKHHWMFQASRR